MGNKDEHMDDDSMRVCVCVCVFLYVYPGGDFYLSAHRPMGTKNEVPNSRPLPRASKQVLDEPHAVIMQSIIHHYIAVVLLLC